MKLRTRYLCGLTFVEVAVVLAVLASLVLMLLPGFQRSSSPGSRTRLGCTSQLKSIGLAFRLFANDHGDKYPFKVQNDRDGSSSFADSPEVFRHFQVASNELITPR